MISRHLFYLTTRLLLLGEVVEGMAAELRIAGSIPARNKYSYGLQLFRVWLFVYVSFCL